MTEGYRYVPKDHRLDLLDDNADDARAKTLLAAAQCVLSDRAAQYGTPEDNFATIADLWSAYILAAHGMVLKFDTVDVALMLDLLKTARLAGNKTHVDSWVDKAGYSACGARCAEKLEPEIIND